MSSITIEETDKATHIRDKSHDSEMKPESSPTQNNSTKTGAASEPQVLPHNNVPVVCVSLMMAVFLVCYIACSQPEMCELISSAKAALDQTVYENKQEDIVNELTANAAASRRHYRPLSPNSGAERTMHGLAGELVYHDVRLYPDKSSAYLLASASSNPLYGKLADVMGRKFVFYPAMCLFLVSQPKNAPIIWC
jgi:hypothetical protein